MRPLRSRLFLFICCCASICMMWKTYSSDLWHSGRIKEFDLFKFREMVCAQLWDKYESAESLKNPIPSAFTADIVLLMLCPWTSNAPQREKYRVELLTCCNGTKEMILTKQNTFLGEKLVRDGDKSTISVDKSLLEMLPEKIPWKTANKRCAVVGNSAILQNSKCASTIDAADFVIRMNLAPINFSTDVGVKTDMMTANPSAITQRFPNTKKDPKPLLDAMTGYGSVPLIMSAFAFRFSTGASFAAYRTLHPQHQVVFFSPKYMGPLHHYWKQKGQKSSRLSTGLIMTSVALEICEEIYLYGFWPFSYDLSGKYLTNHYYNNIGKRNPVHTFYVEFHQLLQMHKMGIIKLHIGKCQ